MPDALFPTIIWPLGNVGYQTDMPTQARTLTHYTKADNVIFEVGGQVRKFGGADKINQTAISGSPNVNGMVDFWFGGGATSFTQKFIAVTANSKIYKEDMDGTFDDITGAASITAGAIPTFGIAINLLVIGFNTRDVILKWDGATAAVSALSATAPRGKGFRFHANRGWIWDGSTLYYSAFGDITDWTGLDTGSFVIDNGDGDEIIGVSSHLKSELIIFKGPNIGSIQIISGTSPTGDDAFSKPRAAVRGIALQSPNAIIPLADGDLAFRSPRGIHLLSAVQKFGDFSPSDVTRYLKKHFSENLSRTNMASEWGVDYKEKNCLLWSTTTSGATEGDQMFCLSYSRLAEDGWKPFTVTRECLSMAMRKNPTTKIDEVVTGSTDGFCRRQDTSARSIDPPVTPFTLASAYSMNLTSPRILPFAGDASGKPRGDQPGVIESMYVRSESVGDYTLSGSIIRDNLVADTYSFALGQNGGFILGTSVLGVDVLGGNDAMEIAYSNPPVTGECRSLKFTLTQGGLNQDANLLELGIEYTPAGQTRQSPVTVAQEAILTSGGTLTP